MGESQKQSKVQSLKILCTPFMLSGENKLAICIVFFVPGNKAPNVHNQENNVSNANSQTIHQEKTQEYP